jgi:hypothetical protein
VTIGLSSVSGLNCLRVNNHHTNAKKENVFYRFPVGFDHVASSVSSLYDGVYGFDIIGDTSVSMMVMTLPRIPTSPSMSRRGCGRW